eukprot:6857182-Prymnesium_polylepis.1
MQLQMGRGKRERQALNYREVNMPLFVEQKEAIEKKEEELKPKEEKKAKAEKKEKEAPPPWALPELLSWDTQHEGRHYVYGFSERDRKAFLRLVMRWGLLGGDLHQLARKCASDADLRRKRLGEIG